MGNPYITKKERKMLDEIIAVSYGLKRRQMLINYWGDKCRYLRTKKEVR
jgi:hypothetical protein